MVEHSTLFPRTSLRDLGENHVLNSFDFGDVEMIDHPGVEFNLGRAQVDVLNQSPCGVGCAHLYATKSRDSIQAGMAFKDVYTMSHVGWDHRRDSRIDENKKINRSGM